MKKLLKAVTALLESIYDQIENGYVKTQSNSVVKALWLVQSNQSVIDTINKLNSRNKAISISIFDFSTLYTNMPHHRLKSVMGELINVCFNGGDQQYIGITRYHCEKYQISPNFLVWRFCGKAQREQSFG